MTMVEIVKADVEGAKERTLYLSEVQDQALIFARSLGVCSRDLCHKNLLHSSVLRRAIHFWKKVLA